MPTKWLHERQNGSKNDLGMPPRRTFCGCSNQHVLFSTIRRRLFHFETVFPSLSVVYEVFPIAFSVKKCIIQHFRAPRVSVLRSAFSTFHAGSPLIGTRPLTVEPPPQKKRLFADDLPSHVMKIPLSGHACFPGMMLLCTLVIKMLLCTLVIRATARWSRATLVGLGQGELQSRQDSFF